jgi:hypothetical protein
MTTVTITYDDGSTYAVLLSDAAKEAVRFAFNPSGLEAVNRLNALAAAFLSECEYQTDTGKTRFHVHGEVDREFEVAKTNMQTALMWAVLGATKDL